MMIMFGLVSRDFWIVLIGVVFLCIGLGIIAAGRFMLKNTKAGEENSKRGLLLNNIKAEEEKSKRRHF